MPNITLGLKIISKLDLFMSYYSLNNLEPSGEDYLDRILHSIVIHPVHNTRLLLRLT